jgi:GT2 family glycosyltransferase
MKNPPSKLIVLVLYKCTLSASQSFMSLLRCSPFLGAQDKIIVWDNSPEALGAAERPKLNSLGACQAIYTHTPENVALSKIYNKAVQINPNYDFAVFLDQDSNFDSDFFSNFHNAQQQHPDIQLFVPLIKNKDVIASPGNFYKFKGKYWKTAKYGVVESKNTVAITSGMILRLSALASVGYFEERLALYGIDTNFMIRYSRLYPSLFVLDVYFDHDLSDFNEETVEVKIKRYQSHRSSSLVNAELFSAGTRRLASLYFMYKSAALCFKFRTLRFF